MIDYYRHGDYSLFKRNSNRIDVFGAGKERINMLIKHQSFEISQRKKTQNRDRSDNLYEAKKCPYLKFILIPGIIGFMLLCILVNVKFVIEVEKTRGNENTAAGVTLFSENVNASSIESSKKDVESKQNMLVVDEHSVTTSQVINIQQERSKDIEPKKVLPTKFVKGFDDEADVELGDATKSKSIKLSSKSLTLNPAKEPERFATQELKRNENGIRIILDVSSKTENRVTKYDKPQIFNSKFEIRYKELNNKTPLTHSIGTISEIFANGKMVKIGEASSKPTFPVVDQIPVTKVPNAYSMHASMIVATQLLNAKDSNRKNTPFVNMSPSEVSNPPSPIFRTSNTLNKFGVAKLSEQQEYKQSSEENNHGIEISIPILLNTGSGNANKISQEVDNIIKLREHERTGPYEQPYKTAGKFNNKNITISESEQNAGKPASLIGKTNGLNLRPDTKYESNGLKNGYTNKSVESQTNFVPEGNVNAHQVLNKSGNDISFSARQDISKGFSLWKLPGSLRYDQVTTTGKTLKKNMLAELTKPVKKPTQHHLTKATTEAIGNAVSQHKAKTIGQYNSDWRKNCVGHLDNNISDTNPLETEIPSAVANHFIETKIFNETPYYKLSNNIKNDFNLIQKVGSAIPDLPTKQKIKEATHTRTEMYFPNKIKHSKKHMQLQNEIPHLKGGSGLGKSTRYSETKINNYKTDSPQPSEPWKWIKRHLGNTSKAVAKNKPLHWEINTALRAGNTVPDFLEQPKQYRRQPRQVESDIKRDYTNNAVIPAMKCTTFRDNCTLLCGTGGVSHLGDDLEYLQDMCPNTDLTLEIRDCVFVDGIMKTNFLNGFYSLQEFRIINCTLTSIQDGAFKQRGVKKLQTLKFINNSIELLTAKTFDGLTVLKHFEFSQHVVEGKSVGDSFLTPMAATLTNVKIMLSYDNNAVVDPSSWLQAPDFVALYIVDLDNNNLQGVLNTETFKSLTALGTLNLQNCSLDAINIKPFEVVLGTLYNLYLNNNYLITLDPMFLNQLIDHQVILSAKGNRWQCDCEHSALIDYMKNENDNKYINVDDFYCQNPQEWKDINMVDVTLSCLAVTTTTASSEQFDSTPSQSTQEEEISSTFTISSTATVTAMTTSPTTTTLDTTLADSTTDVATSPPTDSLDTTTTSDTNITSNLENITCRSHDSLDLLTISIKTRTADLTITSSTSTSVVIVASKDSASIRITYFQKYTQYSTVQPTSTAVWTIHNLNEKQSYMFCLVQDSDDTVSPFDCWGHFMGNSAVGKWLLTSDIGWFVTVIVIAALLFGITAGAAVYFVLRQRPSWVLMSSERMLKVHQSSHKIVLLPKDSSTMRRVSSTSEQLTHQTRRASYLSPTPPCETYSNAPSPLYAPLHKPPTECAPTLPGVVNRNSYSSLCNTPQGDARLNKVTGKVRSSRYTEDTDYGYNTIDHYEEIKF